LYELWIDAGNDLSSNFHKVTSYNGIALQHTLTTLQDAISPPGAIFRMNYRSKNVDGQYSEFSKELIFALGSVPSAPSIPLKNDELSGDDTIALYWNKITTDVIPVDGYKVYADSGYNDDFKLVFDGTNQPEATSYLFKR
jgi:hypothetical protein